MARKTYVVGGALAVDGMKESLSGLRKTRKDLPRAVTKASRELVKKVVLPVAQRKWSSQNIKPSMVKKIVKTSVTTKGAGLVLAYIEYGYAAGVEFGSRAFRQFRPWRGNQWTVKPGSSTGYVMQDAIRETLPIVERRWINEVVEAIDKAVENG